MMLMSAQIKSESADALVSFSSHRGSASGHGPILTDLLAPFRAQRLSLTAITINPRSMSSGDDSATEQHQPRTGWKKRRLQGACVRDAHSDVVSAYTKNISLGWLSAKEECVTLPNDLTYL